jgi:hypothetical protein
MKEYRKPGERDLDPFERWMVKSNVDHLEEYGGLEVVCARLTARGYDRIARAVRQSVETGEQASVGP